MSELTLTTPNDLYMQVLDAVGANPAVEATERGLRVSLFGSATGTAYLSILPKAEIVRLAARARIDEAQLPAILTHAAHVREAGLADGPSSDGSYWSVAMPLPEGLFPAPLILGLAGPAERIRQDLPAMQRLIRDTVECWLAPRDIMDRAPAHPR